MPIYEFQCLDCKKKFDELVSISSDRQIDCPDCHKNNVIRIMSTFGFSSGGTMTTSGGSSCHTCSSGNCATCH